MHTIVIQTLQALQQGDEAAFDAVYRHYYSGLCAFASQHVPRAAAEETVQDVMFWLWENHSQVVPELSLKTLLFTMVKNRCLNQLEHKTVQNRVHEAMASKFAQQFEDPDFYVAAELMNLLEKALEKMTPEYRDAFVMNRFEGKTYAEIATLSSVSEKTIAYRISQALKILRVELKDFLPLLVWLLA